MSKKQIISAAVATGLAVGGAQAATEAEVNEIPLDAPSAFWRDAGDTIIEFDGDLDPEQPDMLIIDVDTPSQSVGDGDGDDFDLAQTLYGGGGGDGVFAPRQGKGGGQPGVQRRQPTVQTPRAGTQGSQVNRRRQVEVPGRQKGQRGQQ